MNKIDIELMREREDEYERITRRLWPLEEIIEFDRSIKSSGLECEYLLEMMVDDVMRKTVIDSIKEGHLKKPDFSELKEKGINVFSKYSPPLKLEETIQDLKTSLDTSRLTRKKFVGFIKNDFINFELYYDTTYEDKTLRMRIYENTNQHSHNDFPEIARYKTQKTFLELLRKKFRPTMFEFGRTQYREYRLKYEYMMLLLDEIVNLNSYPDFVYDQDDYSQKGDMTTKLYDELMFKQDYQEIEFVGKGGTRRIFRGKVGEDNYHIIKVDIPETELDKNNAKLHIERGYNSAKELETILNIPDVEENNIVRLINYIDHEPFHSSLNKRNIVTIEKEVKGRTLEKIVEPNIDKNKVDDLFEKLEEIQKRDSEEEYSKEHWKFSTSDWYQVFQDVAKGLNHLHKNDVYHRDLNRKNIMINKDCSGNIKATIIDLGNAGKTDDIYKKYIERTIVKTGSLEETSFELNLSPENDSEELKKYIDKFEINVEELLKKSQDLFENNDVYVSRCTAGGHFIADPRLIPAFNKGKFSQYGAQSDIYAFGVNLYFALTGERIIELDDLPERGRSYAIDYRTEESLLNEDGSFDYERYENLLEERINEIESNEEDKYIYNIFKKIMKNSLTLTDKGYNNMDEVIDDLNGNVNPQDVLKKYQDTMSPEDYEVLRNNIRK
ncbi:protein kinase [Candidatus Woesearchaeota archaeon]|nr:protein kinase [Candidatus Woesearchaeota archaeon]